jgi:hypothetical protein
MRETKQFEIHLEGKSLYSVEYIYQEIFQGILLEKESRRNQK